MASVSQSSVTISSVVFGALRYRTLVSLGVIPDIVPILRSHYPSAFKTRRYPKHIYSNGCKEEYTESLVSKARSMADKFEWHLSDIEIKGCDFGRPLGMSGNNLIDVVACNKWDVEDDVVKMLLWATFRQEIETLIWILPMHDTIAGISVRGWDRIPFMKEVWRLYDHITSLTLAKLRDPVAYPAHLIGKHIHRDKSMDQVISQRMQKSASPFQVFLGTALSGLSSYDPALCEQAFNETNKYGARWYSHVAHTLKLAQPSDKCRTSLKIELQAARLMGCRGVVIHTGETSDSAVAANAQLNTDCLSQMTNNVRLAIEHASPECPLIIETPAGEKNEMLPFIQQLAQFMNSFSQEEQKRLALCVDTCHVFAAGYHPLEYIKTWPSLSAVPIRLVHFNDSENGVGCHLDRHALPGLGHIGATVMTEIAVYCANNNIDMVNE
jgi:deoxyribonuclease-4